MSQPRKLTESVAKKLESWRREYEAGSPLRAWQAFRLCRLGGIPPPLWVMEYLDRVAQEIVVRPYDLTTLKFGPGRWQDYLVAALGFRTNTPGGPSDPWEAWSKAEDHIELATRVRILVDGEGLNETDAAYLVAQHLDSLGMKTSEPTVRRAWKEWAAEVRQDDLEEQRYGIKVLDEQLAFAASIDRPPSETS